MTLVKLLSINISEHTSWATKYFQSWINAYWLTNSQIVDSVMTIWYIFQINESFTTLVRILLVIFNGST